MALPDPVAAVIARLRADATVTALCPASSITGQPPGGATPTYHVAVMWEPSIGARPWTPEMLVGIGLRCYGPTAYEAARLWRTVHPALESPQRADNGFTAAGCRVKNITLAGGPLNDLNDEGWPLTYASYTALISEVEV